LRYNINTRIYDIAIETLLGHVITLPQVHTVWFLYPPLMEYIKHIKQ